MENVKRLFELEPGDRFIVVHATGDDTIEGGMVPQELQGIWCKAWPGSTLQGSPYNAFRPWREGESDDGDEGVQRLNTHAVVRRVSRDVQVTKSVSRRMEVQTRRPRRPGCEQVDCNQPATHLVNGEYLCEEHVYISSGPQHLPHADATEMYEGHRLSHD